MHVGLVSSACSRGGGWPCRVMYAGGGEGGAVFPEASKLIPAGLGGIPWGPVQQPHSPPLPAFTVSSLGFLVLGVEVEQHPLAGSSGSL